MVFDVIIPVKARPTVVSCIQSLVTSTLVKRIFVCDAGSTDTGGSEVLEQLTTASGDPRARIDVLHCPMPGFNKARLLNHGLSKATAEFVLISDADIIWNQATLEALHHPISSQNHAIACVANVQESNPKALALRRDRYTYEITHQSNGPYLAIQPVMQTGQVKRPGCGLLGARRTTLLSLGGYKEMFQGWGWEDQDLLIRAQLLGISVTSMGDVIHLSHGDDCRNPFHNHRSPSETRNYNILVAIAALLNHQFKGNLAAQAPDLPEPKNLQIYLPHALRDWLDAQLCEGFADHHLSATRDTFKDAIGLVAPSEKPWVAGPLRSDPGRSE